MYLSNAVQRPRYTLDLVLAGMTWSNVEEIILVAYCHTLLIKRLRLHIKKDGDMFVVGCYWCGVMSDE